MRAMFSPPYHCCAFYSRMLGRAPVRAEALLANQELAAGASSRVHPDATLLDNTPFSP